MTKSFNEYEKEIIRQKLLESCEESWGRYGYKKTNVAELCKMAGISTGAFYMFYESKEMLFIDVFNKVEESFNTSLEQLMPENPTKYDFARVFKTLFHELEKIPWFLNIHNDFDLLLRKFPPDYVTENFSHDITNISSIVERYHFKPKISIELITSMTYIILLSVQSRSLSDNHYSEAIDLMIDCVIEKYFE
ncbi:MAG: TetR/AcrR family transcriptional regulator [Bacillota bacterium]|nr:TetR/AcrR family transcriptional regulator [Bacillota bacterium]